MAPHTASLVRVNLGSTGNTVDRLCRCARLVGITSHTEFLHVKPGKGAAFVRSKLKNYLTGNTVEKTFRAGEMVDTAVVERKDSEFTYVDGAEVRCNA